MTEQQHQKKISDHLEDKGWYVIRLMQTNKAGVPDLVAFHPNYPPLFIEVKTEKGSLQRLQEFVIGILRNKFNQQVIVAYGYPDYLKKYSLL